MTDIDFLDEDNLFSCVWQLVKGSVPKHKKRLELLENLVDVFEYHGHRCEIEEAAIDFEEVDDLIGHHGKSDE